MDDLDNPVVEEPPHDGGTSASPGIRLGLVDAALGRGATRLAEALEDFLAEEDSLRALEIWLEPEKKSNERVFATLARDIAAIDALISEQLDAILHHDDVKRIEATWRGVEYLLQEAQDDEKVRIRIFNATWYELARDFDRAVEFDQSALFAKVYSEEYGMPGGVPYGLLLCDYAVRHRRPTGAGQAIDDVGALSGLAEVAAAAFSPCVIGAAPELFGVSSFSDLSYVQRLDAGFRLAEYQRWRKLREQEESRFLGITLPRILLRERYSNSSSREEGFVYRENGGSLDSWLWGNAIYAFGAVVIRTFIETGWFADIRGARIENDETDVAGLPAPRFSTGEATAYRRPLEVELTDKKQKALEDLGFVSISPCNFTKSVVLLGTQSLHAVPNEGDTAERSNARLSAMLHYALCVSRFAHYVKVMARDRIGGFTTAAALERFLADWLQEYTIGNADAGPELRARYPLSGARIEVKELPGRPGVMGCTMHLQPHFQIDQMVTGLRLRTDLEPVGGR
ncbi:type VI secretion system contractile sheath large subunit [Nitratireductor sp. GCM10026969]|uniref:type VI secretion system contractile sheath large subunit n=1 Tax=Nitratireductor sp. GCM10026969 TaxID=3252645 RepID=UPI00361A41DF